MGNIALNKQATASNSILPYVPSRAVDGNLSASNRWVSGQVPTAMTVDLGASYLVDRWVVKHPAIITAPAGWSAPNYANSDFKLQGSNNQTSWVDLDTVVNNTVSITDRTIPPAPYRYFRLAVTKGLQINNQTTSVMEFELYQAYSAVLTNLAISAGTLTPTFSPATLNYTATVNPDVASINVTPTALSPMAVIKVNNVPVASGNASPVALNVGSNTITVNVTDGAVTQNYVITVTRIGSLLSSLAVQSGTANIALNPAFVKTRLNYTASVENSIPNVTFTPTAETAGSTIKINDVPVVSGQQSTAFPLNNATSNFNIVVTSNGVSATYTVAITKASSLILNQAIVTYSGRSISTGTKTIAMNQTDLVYSTSVPTGATSITITPLAADSNVVIRVNSVVVASGFASGPINLVAGTTSIPVTVSTADGSSSRNYTINITIG